jgi:hypothetical protein
MGYIHPDIAPSDFHLFSPLKDTVHGMKMESMMWSKPSELRLHQHNKKWHQLGIHAPVPNWQKTIELHAEFVEFMIHVYKQRFDLHFVLSSSSLNKYLVRKNVGHYFLDIPHTCE